MQRSVCLIWDNWSAFDLRSLEKLHGVYSYQNPATILMSEPALNELKKELPLDLST